MNNKDYKKAALERLSDNWGKEALIYFIYSIPFFLVSLLFPPESALNLIMTILLIPLSLGLSYHYLMIADGKDGTTNSLLKFYQSKEVIGLVLIQIVVGIFTFLWSLLFIIPGIIMSMAYTLSIFIKFENPGMDTMDVIRTSKEWMDGRKMDYFILILSFIGWFFLSGLLFGIPLFWVMPYYMVTISNFYIDVRDSHQKTKINEA